MSIAFVLFAGAGYEPKYCSWKKFPLDHLWSWRLGAPARGPRSPASRGSGPSSKKGSTSIEVISPLPILQRKPYLVFLIERGHHYTIDVSRFPKIVRNADRYYFLRSSGFVWICFLYLISSSDTPYFRQSYAFLESFVMFSYRQTLDGSRWELLRTSLRSHLGDPQLSSPQEMGRSGRKSQKDSWNDGID